MYTRLALQVPHIAQTDCGNEPVFNVGSESLSELLEVRRISKIA